MSIRTYLFSLLTTLVLIIAIALSYQSGRLFVSAMDLASEGMMYSIGLQYPKSGKVEQKILNFHATTDWLKVPQAVRQRFPNIPKEKNVHHSIFEDWIYITPPERAYSLMVVEHEGRQVFVSRFNEHIAESMEKHRKNAPFFIDPMVLVLIVGISVIVIFILTLLSTFKKIAVPVESLQQWAKKLKVSELGNDIPDFKYKELNGLASLMHENLASVAESVKREQRFLSYASHELRTPIAVLRSNTALLEKINPEPSEKERLVRDRIERASLTMKSMTETLLWLSREGETDMPFESVNLGELIESRAQELSYLLAGKSVAVNFTLDASAVELALTPSIIVLNNLLRNAFQHTQQGQVDIIQAGNKVIITNTEFEQEEGAQSHDELGFGLGMQLVEKLTKQFGWQYSANKLINGYTVTVKFNGET